MKRWASTIAPLRSGPPSGDIMDSYFIPRSHPARWRIRKLAQLLKRKIGKRYNSYGELIFQNRLRQLKRFSRSETS